MTSPIQVPTDALRTHSRSLTDIAGDVEVAHGAANQVYLDAGAFGKLCSFLPSLFDPVLRAAVDAISETANGLSGSSDNLKRVADRYDATDQQSAATVEASGDHNIQLPL